MQLVSGFCSPSLTHSSHQHLFPCVHLPSFNMDDPDLAKLPRAHTTDSADLERYASNRGRVTYAPSIRARRGSNGRDGHARSRSRDSMSIRSNRRSVDPSIILPPQFRTLSFGIEEGKRRSFSKNEELPTRKSKKSKSQSKKQAAQAEFGDIDYHLASIEDLFRRFSSSRSGGLSASEAANQLKTVGRNLPSPPPSRWFKQTIGYLFGGFGSILFIAAVLVFIAWKPLGEPNPAVANLALAIVLVAVWLIQAGE